MHCALEMGQCLSYLLLGQRELAAGGYGSRLADKRETLHRVYIRVYRGKTWRMADERGNYVVSRPKCSVHWQIMADSGAG